MKKLPKRAVADFSIEAHYAGQHYMLTFGGTKWAVSGDAIRQLMRYVEESESDETMPPDAAKALIAQWAKELEEEHA